MAHAAARLTRELSWLGARIAVRGLPAGARMPTPDRRVLEDRIFHALVVDPAVHLVVFAGCSSATAWYPALFAPRRAPRLVTVDPDPAAAQYGAAGDHRVARFQDLAQDPGLRGQVDVVVLNGVFAYGIDDEAAQRAALDTAVAVLRAGGALLLGYRDDAAHQDVLPGVLDRTDLVATPIPGVGTPILRTGSANGHTFAAYVRV